MVEWRRVLCLECSQVLVCVVSETGIHSECQCNGDNRRNGVDSREHLLYVNELQQSSLIAQPIIL
jgi:hypothetical protein